MNLPMEAPPNTLLKSMLEEVQTIRRWDGLEPVADTSGIGAKKKWWKWEERQRREVPCQGSGRKSWRRRGEGEVSCRQEGRGMEGGERKGRRNGKKRHRRGGQKGEEKGCRHREGSGTKGSRNQEGEAS